MKTVSKLLIGFVFGFALLSTSSVFAEDSLGFSCGGKTDARGSVGFVLYGKIDGSQGQVEYTETFINRPVEDYVFDAEMTDSHDGNARIQFSSDTFPESGSLTTTNLPSGSTGTFNAHIVIPGVLNEHVVCRLAEITEIPVTNINPFEGI